MDAHGLFSADRLYGLELQQPFSSLVLDGSKTVETRSYELPQNLLYKHILIIESKAGEDGVSGIGNLCENNTKDDAAEGADEQEEYPRIVGSVVFGECFEYHTERMWNEDQQKHAVPVGSYYSWPRARMDHVEQAHEQEGEGVIGSGLNVRI